ncbi:hypothetical protein VT06_07285 [Arsukibacterium sp. MJ3]|uniref:polysaccharide deacetylase family protein n=1 Tax=Arsukibacterium sp. MJ3 TaxID=1632859 RepID=UPI0006273572|nr:polysaccharide deacetylase family protein [Arsukibacterium sp. MJ3]KKO49308.1 hypothetical protein VT06_07285 [Arsukibacterium sp. MJ3]
MKKTFILLLLKWLGMFWLAKKITTKRPRILCYHGISVDDEHLFSPGVFMRSSTFARRMTLVAKWGYQPVSLDELYRQQQTGQYLNDTLVITIDDGWAAIEQGILPSLRKHNFKATLYLCTYFVENQRPVFNLAVCYLFWKHRTPFILTENSSLTPYTAETQLDIENLLSLSVKLGASYEQAILQELADCFGEDLSQWQQNGKLMFLAPEKVTALAAEGLSIELHTHRHRFCKINLANTESELIHNKQYIAKLTGKQARHFCFPSGRYRPEQVKLLADMEIKTATTTENSLVNIKKELLTLPRLVDNDNISELEFEAELTGLMTLLRLGTSFLKPDNTLNQ